MILIDVDILLMILLDVGILLMILLDAGILLMILYITLHLPFLILFKVYQEGRWVFQFLSVS